MFCCRAVALGYNIGRHLLHFNVYTTLFVSKFSISITYDNRLFHG